MTTLFCAKASAAGWFGFAPATARNVPKSLTPLGTESEATSANPMIAIMEWRKMKGVLWWTLSAQKDVPRATKTASIYGGDINSRVTGSEKPKLRRITGMK